MMTKIEDPILKKIVEQVLQHCKPQKIVLFGSRARGDYREKSDYDISVSGINESNYAEVLNAIDDNDFTLKKIDLIWAMSVECGHFWSTLKVQCFRTTCKNHGS